jgi:hypothetical protein
MAAGDRCLPVIRLPQAGATRRAPGNRGTAGDRTAGATPQQLEGSITAILDQVRDLAQSFFDLNRVASHPDLYLRHRMDLGNAMLSLGTRASLAQLIFTRG